MYLLQADCGRCSCGQPRQAPSRKAIWDWFSCLIRAGPAPSAQQGFVQFVLESLQGWRFLCLSGLSVLMLKYFHSEVFFLMMPHCGSLSPGACPVTIVPCSSSCTSLKGLPHLMPYFVIYIFYCETVWGDVFLLVLGLFCWVFFCIS